MLTIYGLNVLEWWQKLAWCIKRTKVQQQWVANAVGVSKYKISRWTRGESLEPGPSEPEQREIAKFFQVTWEQMFKKGEPLPPILHVGYVYQEEVETRWEEAVRRYAQPPEDGCEDKR